jgi:hypothetical protein
MVVTHNTIEFPACFSEAKNKLHMKFRGLDNAIIEDSIQHARIEYWMKGIASLIPDESDAFGWFLNVAHRYLYKEVNRLSKNCSIYLASSISTGTNPEIQYIYQDLLSSFSGNLSENPTSILLEHASGYSLKEMAIKEQVTLAVMKHKHAKERKHAAQKAKILFY